jgi:hypothetical protein
VKINTGLTVDTQSLQEDVATLEQWNTALEEENDRLRRVNYYLRLIKKSRTKLFGCSIDWTIKSAVNVIVSYIIITSALTTALIIRRVAILPEIVVTTTEL